MSCRPLLRLKLKVVQVYAAFCLTPDFQLIFARFQRNRELDRFVVLPPAGIGKGEIRLLDAVHNQTATCPPPEA